MPQIKVKGIQVDVEDVAAEIAADPLAIGEIADGVIADAGATAAFDADYLRRDGTVLMLGALNLGVNNLITTGTVAGRNVALDGTAQDTHIADASLHFTEASIDHTAIANIGTNSHAQIDTHVGLATVHFTEASIDHTAIINIGTNTHAQIDTHVGLATVHFTEASIDHTAITNIGTNTHAAIDTHVAGSALNHAAADVVNTPAGDIAATNVQSAIDELDTEKAPLASPTFTGVPVLPLYTVGTLPTAADGTMIYVTDAAAAGGTGAMCFGRGVVWIDVTTHIAVV